MLTVNQLTKRYGDDLIFENVSFVVNAGERVGLVGPNGCGKTTLLRIITGEEAATSGVVGISPPAAFMLAMAGMFLSGFMNPMTNGPLFAIVQARVEPQMQGRVFTLLTSVASAMVPLAMLIAGPISDLVGVRIWYFVAGAGCTLIGAATLLLPTVMKIEVEEQQAQPVIKSEIGCGSEASS